jgi:translation elongation factor EF-1alpha
MKKYKIDEGKIRQGNKIVFMEKKNESFVKNIISSCA